MGAATEYRYHRLTWPIAPRSDQHTGPVQSQIGW